MDENTLRSVPKRLLVVVLFTFLYHQPQLRRFARRVVAKYARDGPMTENEITILWDAPKAIAYVAGLVTGALAGQTPWYVYLTCSRRQISAV